MKKIGFIGIGIMGKSMVRNLMKAGYEVAVYNRTKAKAEDVVAEGALWCDSCLLYTSGRGGRLEWRWPPRFAGCPGRRLSYP